MNIFGDDISLSGRSADFVVLPGFHIVWLPHYFRIEDLTHDSMSDDHHESLSSIFLPPADPTIRQEW
jgi:hypothetical protein